MGFRVRVLGFGFWVLGPPVRLRQQMSHSSVLDPAPEHLSLLRTRVSGVM